MNVVSRVLDFLAFSDPGVLLRQGLFLVNRNGRYVLSLGFFKYAALAVRCESSTGIDNKDLDTIRVGWLLFLFGLNPLPPFQTFLTCLIGFHACPIKDPGISGDSGSSD